MDTGLSIKPVAATPTTDAGRPAVAVPGAAPTELPDAKAVNPTAESAAADRAVQQPTNGDAAYISHNFVIDPQSREVIYRVMDTRTRQVIWQQPDAALLRNRSYAQTLKDATSHSVPQTTDLTE